MIFAAVSISVHENIIENIITSRGNGISIYDSRPYWSSSSRLGSISGSSIKNTHVIAYVHVELTQLNTASQMMLDFRNCSIC